MDYTTLTPPPLTSSQASQSELATGNSLYEALRSLPDPRRGQGKRYALALLLCLLLLAKLAGQTSLRGATEWIRHRDKDIAAHFGLKRTQMPCQMTYCRMLTRLDPQVFDELLAAFFIRLRGEASLWERTEPPAHPSGTSRSCAPGYRWQNRVCHEQASPSGTFAEL